MLLFLFQLTNGDHLHYYIYCVRVGILCMFVEVHRHIEIRNHHPAEKGMLQLNTLYRSMTC